MRHASREVMTRAAVEPVNPERYRIFSMRLTTRASIPVGSRYPRSFRSRDGLSWVELPGLSGTRSPADRVEPPAQYLDLSRDERHARVRRRQRLGFQLRQPRDR